MDMVQQHGLGGVHGKRCIPSIRLLEYLWAGRANAMNHSCALRAGARSDSLSA